MSAYTKMPNYIAESDCLTFSERSVFLYLCIRAGNKKECFPSISRISNDLRCSQSTVIRCLKSLENKGFIKKIRRRKSDGGNSSNLYIVENDAY